MEQQLEEVVFVMYQPYSANDKPTAYRVTSGAGIREVAELVKARTGHVHFICDEEFFRSDGVERLTDCPLDGVDDTQNDSVFRVWLGGGTV